MSRTPAAVALALAFTLPLVAAGSAAASPASDDLGRCLVKASSSDDKTTLMVWAFTALSAHPSVKVYANVSDAQRLEVSKNAARLLERLTTVDCRKETLAAFKTDGPASLQGAFSTLGQVAVGGLVQDPAVAKAMSVVTTQLDMAKFQSLALELMNSGGAPK
jgi:hypothetical protein